MMIIKKFIQIDRKVLSSLLKTLDSIQNKVCQIVIKMNLAAMSLLSLSLNQQST